VRFERDLGMFWEWDVQRWAQSLPGLPAVLGVAYIGLHVAATIAALVWVYRRHRERFALLRTVLVASSAFALVLYAVYPTAPPRLAGLGIADTVTDHAASTSTRSCSGRCTTRSRRCRASTSATR
jgi:cytochrome bd-type quinol oxidase subunit 2